MALHNPLDDLLQTIGAGAQSDPLSAPQAAPGLSPTFPSAAPQLPPQVSTTPQRGGRLTELLPLIAAAVAAAKGGLPGYAQGLYTSTENRRERTREDERLAESNRRYEEGFRFQQERAAEQDARFQAQEERQQALEEHRQASERIDLIRGRVEAAFKNNPALADQIKQLGPEKFSLQVPGLGNINFKQALDAIGGFQAPDGTYPLNEFVEPPPPVKLITGPGRKRIPDVEGAEVYERPRVPARPPTPPRPKTRMEDAQTLAAIRKALEEEGRDPGWAETVMNDPDALSELVAKYPEITDDYYLYGDESEDEE